MEKLYKIQIIFILLFSLVFANNTSAQVIPFYEDFEGVAPTLEFTANENPINGLSDNDYTWFYETTTAFGWLNFETVAYEGIRAPLMAASADGFSNINYLILEIDLSAYDLADELSLNFRYVDFGDESSPDDKVWIRGSNGDGWLQVYDLDPNSRLDTEWNEVYEIDLTSVLSVNGQNYSATFQLRFGQDDDFTYDSDGIAFDNISITHTGVQVIDIINQYNSPDGCSSGKLGVEIQNYDADDRNLSNVTLNINITGPNGTQTENLSSFLGTINAGAQDTLFWTDFDYSTPGTYIIETSVTLTDAYVHTHVDSIIVKEPYAIENGDDPATYLESFIDTDELYSKWWDMGEGFDSTTVAGSLYRFLSNSSDTLVSPYINISDDYFMEYRISPSNFNADDTIFIEITQACSDVWEIIDTVYYDQVAMEARNGYYNIIGDHDGYLLDSYVGKNVQFRFVMKTTNTFTMQLEDLLIKPARNIEVTGVILSDYPNCGTNDYPINISIVNHGAYVLGGADEYNIKVEVYNANTDLLENTYNKAIEYNENAEVYVGTIEALPDGEYELVVTVNINGNEDDDLSDNTYQEVFTVYAPQQLPIVIGTGEYADDSSDPDFHLLTHNATLNNANIEFDQVQEDVSGNQDYDSAYVATQKIDAIIENSYIGFDYYIETDNGTNMYALGDGDEILVQVSDNCGQGTPDFTTIYTINEDNDHEGDTYQTIESIDLSAYIGQHLIFRILAKKDDANETSWFQLYLKNIHIGPADVEPTDILYDANVICGATSEEFEVVVRNNSNVKAVNVPVTFEITGENYNDTIVTLTISELPPMTTDTIVAGTFDIAIPQEYSLNAGTQYVNDYDETNNEFDESFTMYGIQETPVVEPFLLSESSGSGSSDWGYDESDSWHIDSDGFLQGTGDYLDSPRDNAGINSLITGKIGPIQTGDKFSFDYRVNTYEDDGYVTLLGHYFREGDYIKVYVSTDCGVSWGTELLTIDMDNVNNTADWQYIPQIDLAAYEGQNIRVKVDFNKATDLGSIITYINTVNIINSGDAGVTEVGVPQYTNGVAICGVASDQAMVVVKNHGINEIDAVPVELAVVFENNEDTVKLNGVTGAILPSESDTIYISGINTEQSGDYELIAYTTLEDDLDNTNDEATGALLVQSVHMVPWTYDGSSTPADWQYYETTVSAWSLSGGYLRTPLMNEDDTAFVTMQKVGTIATGYKLRVSYNAFAFDNDDDFIANYLRDDDKFEVQVSDDCGASYTSIATMTSANHVNNDEDTTLVIDLDAYSGKNISVRLMVVKGSSIGKLRVDFDEVRFTIPSPNISLASIYVEDGICGKASEPVFAIISNISEFDAATGFTINAEISDDIAGNTDLLDTLSYTYSGILEPGKTDTVQIGTFDSQTTDITYEIDALAVFNGDIDESNNDASTSFKIWLIMPNNYATDFSWGGTDGFDEDEGWKYDDVTDYSGDEIRSNEVLADFAVEVYSPKFEALAENSTLVFDYSVTSGEFGIGDLISVYASTDCGATYQLVESVDNADNLSTFGDGTVGMSLTAYAGQEVQFAIQFKNVNNGSFWVEIDNFAIQVTDVAAIGVVTETDKFDIDLYNENDNVFNYAERYITCGDATDELWVVVENSGSTDITSIDVTLDYTGKATGQLTGNYTGNLEPGKRAAISVGTVDTETFGLLDMRVTATVTDDAITDNDIIGFSTTTQETYEVPYDAYNSEHFNESYYWKYDDNVLMLGGDNLASNWNDLYAESLDKGDTAYATSPKLLLGVDASLYFKYTVSNSLNEGHIIHDEIAEVLVSTNCADTWTQIWSLDVNNTDFGANGTVGLDLSAYAGQQIRLMFRGIKGYSDGLFTLSFDDVNVQDFDLAEITLAVDGEVQDISTPLTLCEGISINLSTNWVTGFNYEWKVENAEKEESILSSNNGWYTLQAADTGKIVLYLTSANTNIAYTNEIDIVVDALPTLPIITGDTEIVTNVGTTEYTATADNADNYIWSISAGTGEIIGNEIGTVYWPEEGYIGMTQITVQGSNACDVGPIATLNVYIEFLNPQGSNSENDASETTKQAGELSVNAYPNPNNGNFKVELPEGKTNCMLTIQDNMGLKVLQKNVTNNIVDIDINHLSTGIYHLTLLIDGEIHSMTIIKK